jgi:UDP-N-acetylenolpyruvoylglucosamine reductase
MKCPACVHLKDNCKENYCINKKGNIKWVDSKTLNFGYNGKVGKHILFRVYFDAALPIGIEKRYRIETSLPKLGIYKKNRYHKTLDEAQQFCDKLFNIWYAGLHDYNKGD